uniref:Uncharacterized protein n=1 Tax=Anguilla anguilla TaxID=7936 RepID=A0A0E9SYC4_ANGAN
MQFPVFCLINPTRYMTGSYTSPGEI